MTACGDVVRLVRLRPRVLSAVKACRRLLTETHRLDVEGGGNGPLTVLLDGRGGHSFPIDSPEQTEAEDVPADVADPQLTDPRAFASPFCFAVTQESPDLNADCSQLSGVRRIDAGQGVVPPLPRTRTPAATP